MKNNNIQVNLLIFIAILILLRIVAVIPKTRIEASQKNHDNFLPNCDFSHFEAQNSYIGRNLTTQGNLSFLSKSQKKRSKIGSQAPWFAKHFLEKKGLINSMSILATSNTVLLKHWVREKLGLFCEVKNDHLKRVNQLVPGQEFRLINGVLFGDFSRESYRDDELYHSFKTIGMLHVVSASGYNITLVMVLVERVIDKISPGFVQTITILSALWFYAVLTGFNASIVRAAVMATLGMTIKKMKRQYHPLFGLIITSIFMVMINPRYLISISFQFSVLASLGIILVVSSLSRQTHQHQGVFGAVFTVFRESFLTSGAAQLFVMPLLLYHFGEFSALSLLSNTLLLWFIPLITLSSLVLFFLVLFNWSFLDLIVGVVALFVESVIEAFLASVAFFAQFGQTLIKLQTPFYWWMVVLWWIGAFIFLKYVQKQNI